MRGMEKRLGLGVATWVDYLTDNTAAPAAGAGIDEGWQSADGQRTHALGGAQSDCLETHERVK
jgi:hypothetical protein